MYQAYDQWGHQFRTLGQELESQGARLEQQIMDQTKTERNALEKAVETLQKKVQSIVETPSFQKEQQTYETTWTQRMALLEKTVQVFLEERNTIMNHTTWSWDEKQRRIHKMFDYFKNQFMTDKERTDFETMVSQPLTVLPYTIGKSRSRHTPLT